jgi:hypothetical protein
VVGLVSSWPAGAGLGALAASRVPCGGCRALLGATRWRRRVLATFGGYAMATVAAGPGRDNGLRGAHEASRQESKGERRAGT